MDKTIILYLCGIHSLFFTIFHIGFWKLFDWKTDLLKLKRINKGIMEVLNIQLTLMLFFVSLLCFFYTNQLISTELGKIILIGISIFWLVRAINDFFFFRLKLAIEFVFFGLFILGFILFLLPVL